MNIRFNGVVEKRTKGCPVCGRLRQEVQFSAVRAYILPSGRNVTFRVGKTVEVSDKDGAFLLTYKYTDNEGHIKPVFEVV